MIYDPIPVILLSTLASEKDHSTNQMIAEFILTHRQQAAQMNIGDLARECHAGSASVSRFCRDIGLPDFASLKLLLQNTDFSFEQVSDRSLDASADYREYWCRHISRSVTAAVQSLDMRSVKRLCEDISSCEKAAAYGLLKAQSAAISLQTDLLMLGRQITTSVSFAEQKERILTADEHSLLIIFSCTGTYFDTFTGQERQRLLSNPSRAKIWLVAGKDKNGTVLPGFIDDHLLFRSPLDQLSHPFVLEAAAAIIAQEYSRMFLYTQT